MSAPGQSVRLRFVGWWNERLDLLIERIAKQRGHVVIKAQPRHYGRLAANDAIGVNAGAIGSQAHHMLTAPVTAPNNTVDYQLAPIGQVYDERLVFGTHSHQGLLGQNANVNRWPSGVQS